MSDDSVRARAVGLGAVGPGPAALAVVGVPVSYAGVALVPVTWYCVGATAVPVGAALNAAPTEPSRETTNSKRVPPNTPDDTRT